MKPLEGFSETPESMETDALFNECILIIAAINRHAHAPMDINRLKNLLSELNFQRSLPNLRGTELSNHQKQQIATWYIQLENLQGHS